MQAEMGRIQRIRSHNGTGKQGLGTEIVCATTLRERQPERTGESRMAGTLRTEKRSYAV